MPPNICSLFRMQAECILPAYTEVEPHVSYGQATARVNLGDTCVYDGDESRHNVRSCETHWVVFMQLMRKMLLQVGRLLLVLLWVHPWRHAGHGPADVAAAAAAPPSLAVAWCCCCACCCSSSWRCCSCIAADQAACSMHTPLCFSISTRAAF